MIGNDTAITIGGMQGQFELNVRIPLIARNLLQSIHLLAATSTALRREVRRRDHRQQGRREAVRRGHARRGDRAEQRIGYDKATVIVKKAAASGRPLREVALEEGVDAKLYDATIDLRKIAAGNE